MISDDKSWTDESAILHLAKNDHSALEKKVKKFLKNLFKTSNQGDATEKIDESELVAKLSTFCECISKVGKKKDCKHFVAFTLDLFIGHSKIRESLLEKRDQNKLARRKLIELFCLLCTSQLEICKDRNNLVDLILGTYDATFSVEGKCLLHRL